MEQGLASGLPSLTPWPRRRGNDDGLVERVAIKRSGPAMDFQIQELDRRKRRRCEERMSALDTKESRIHSPRRRQQRPYTGSRSMGIMMVLMCMVLFMVQTASAGFVSFQNCLPSGTLKSRDPQRLQFVPLYVDAVFDTQDSRHVLDVTVYGNVTGRARNVTYPDPNNWNASDPNFNIVDAPRNYTTLFANIDVLSYSAWHPDAMRFCNETDAGSSCPWQPLFNTSKFDVDSLHRFTVSNAMNSAYSFASFSTELKVQSGDEGGPLLACISAGIAPDLGDALSNALAYVPAAILALVGIATVLAARFSPWSSSDVFYWTSNYGRDDDILRLVTPGFGDCLQYIQFVVLAGSLSLGYPAFFQPVISQAAWSVLMFNESFVSQGNGYQSLVDGVYSTNGTHGLTRLSQLVGMSEDKDVWAGMAVWLCVIIVSVIVLCQLGFAGRTLVRLISDIPEEDLRSKNLPFTSGNVVRIVFNYFLLPIISLSMFQLVVATNSPVYVVVLAVILIVAIVAFAAWMFRLIFTTKPRVHLFDHLPLLLAYGPLYNTYSDEAAPYSFIPFLLTFIRGIAMGAVQPSGIAQLVILAICEVVLILTLHAFRPFQSLTSMNAYHTFFSVIRLVTVLLMVAFVPSLDVSESIKGWIGYAVLLLHAIVLIFGFFLNSIQTMIEVFARLAGAGRETRGGLASVFGMRQLSKRVKRRDARDSMTSHATALTETKSMNRNSRAMSASSTMMLNNSSPDPRGSALFDNFSQADGSMVSGTSPGPSTPGARSPFSFLPGSDSSRRASKPMEPSAPYYRPPRQRRPTNELLQEEATIGEDTVAMTRPRRASQPLQQAVYSDLTEAPSVLGSERGSVGAAYFRAFHNDSGDLGDSRRRNVDYATRESDFYYGVRGPALSSTPTRRLKTGPADPMSPVSSATGWFKHIFGNKTKDKSKGFEVVRSTPLHMLQERDEQPEAPQEPYTDKPGPASPPVKRSVPVVAESPTKEPEPAMSGAGRPSSDTFIPQDESELMAQMRHASTRSRKVPDAPPMLAPLSVTGSLHVPSRTGSTMTTESHRPPMPALPRRSSKRNSKGDILPPGEGLSRIGSFRGPGNTDPEARVPFASLNDHFETENGKRSGRTSMASSIYPGSDTEGGENAPEPIEHHPQLQAQAQQYRSMSPYEKQRIGTPKTGRVGSWQNEEFVYSHPYDGHFSAQPGPSYAQAGAERPLSTGIVVKHAVREGVYTGSLHQGSEAELVEEEERKNSMKRL